MTSSDRNAQTKFRRDALNVMVTHSELVTDRLTKTEEAVSALTQNVGELTEGIKAQSGNIDRLERAVTRMVDSNEAQRETINNLIRLATALVERQAS